MYNIMLYIIHPGLSGTDGNPTFEWMVDAEEAPNTIQHLYKYVSSPAAQLAPSCPLLTH